MCIGTGLLMAGEMFAAGQHPGIPQAAGHGAAIIRDGLHSLPIITAFRRAGKSIQHRRTVQINTQCPQLTAHHTPNFVGVGGIARAGNDHGAGKNRGFAAQAGNTAALLVDGDKIEKLNTKTKETISPLVYPSWHPSGKYVAFSVNTTKQAFHLNDRNRVEVYDEASDVVVYDVEKHEIVTASNIFSKDAFETFPTFSPDGKTLYFCTAEARPIPQEYSEVKYNLCSVSFDPVTRAFGAQVDTLYNAKSGGMSASFPRVSPDGRYLLYTLSGYGNFSIWHKDADLYMADLQTGTSRPLVEVNSDDVESYHSWSSNSRWFVFSSRRIDGLYTRPYIAYVDEDGKVGKPFLLPQKDAGFYQSFMKSFNIPEFITGKVKVRGRVLAIKAKEDKGTDVRLAQQ